MRGIFYGTLVYFGTIALIMCAGEDAPFAAEDTRMFWGLLLWFWIGLIGPSVALVVSNFIGDS